VSVMKHDGLAVWTYSHSLLLERVFQPKSFKAVPLHATETLWGKGGVASTHS
jgi:hypothetical protein